MEANISNLERCRETDLQGKFFALNLHYKEEIRTATWWHRLTARQLLPEC